MLGEQRELIQYFWDEINLLLPVLVDESRDLHDGVAIPQIALVGRHGDEHKAYLLSCADDPRVQLLYHDPQIVE